MPQDIKQLQQDMQSDNSLLERFKTNPQEALFNYVENYPDKNPKEWDMWIYRIIVLSLGVTILSIVIGVLIVLFKNQKIESENLITIVASIGSAAIGALAGLLAPSPKQSSN